MEAKEQKTTRSSKAKTDGQSSQDPDMLEILNGEELATDRDG